MEYAKALADYDEAIRLDPQQPEPWASEARIAATCLQGKFRDGKRAVQQATKASELTGWKDYSNLDTLAAAYAELGDFANAVKWEEKALPLVALEKDVRTRIDDDRDLRSHLDLFKAHKPYHEEARK
jgi:tetratricopeptide (TPR) repeat protein